MADNKYIKDGQGNSFLLRMRDVSSAADGTLQRSMIYATPYPLDYGGGGIYMHCAKSGILAPYMPANSPIYSFRCTSAGMVALVYRVKLIPWTVTAFSGGLANFDFFVARDFISSDTGGVAANLGSENNQLRTSMAASSAAIQYANTGGLTPGIRTLDAAPLDSRTVLAPQTDNTLFPSDPMVLFERIPGAHPLYLAQNEGFVIRASVPNSNSTWQFSVTAEWVELLPQNF